MIVAIFGVPGLSFAELTYLLTELGIGFMAVTDKPQKVGEPNKNHVVPVVFSSARSLLQHHSKIKFRSVALVCDNYAKLKREHGWTVVGTREVSKNGHEYVQFGSRELGDLIQSADLLARSPVEIEGTVPKAYDPASEMISKFADSALSQTQSMMYKVKNQEIRSKTFAMIRGWFVGDVKTSDTLQSRLRSIHTSDKYVTDLMNIMTAPAALTLRRVTIEVKKNPDRLEIVTKKAKISPFDVRYLLSKGKR